MLSSISDVYSPNYEKQRKIMFGHKKMSMLRVYLNLAKIMLVEKRRFIFKSIHIQERILFYKEVNQNSTLYPPGMLVQ